MNMILLTSALDPATDEYTTETIVLGTPTVYNTYIVVHPGVTIPGPSQQLNIFSLDSTGLGPADEGFFIRFKIACFSSMPADETFVTRIVVDTNPLTDLIIAANDTNANLYYIYWDGTNLALY